MDEVDVNQNVDLVRTHCPVVVTEPDVTTVVDDVPAPWSALIELYSTMPLVPSTMPLLAVAIITFR